MAKGPTITTIASGYYSRTALNTNFTNIDAAFDNTLSLDGSTPNSMQGDLDLNGNQITNGVGKFNTLYIDNVLAGNLATAFTFLGAWVTGTSYSAYDVVTDSGNTYIALETHTAGSTFSTDLAAAKWSVLATKGATGAGTGDMLVANNLSDVANVATSRSNLGLGASDTPTFADLILGPVNPNLTSSDADGYLALSGDSTVDAGANMRLFSAAHATNAGDFSFRNGTTATLRYDAATTLWDFQANDVVTTGTVTATSYAGDGSALTGLDEFTYTGSAPLFACRAWGNVGSDALADGGNFASWDGATDTVTFTTAMPHANYAVTVNGASAGNAWASSMTTTGFTVNQRSSGGNTIDPTNFEFIVVC